MVRITKVPAFAVQLAAKQQQQDLQLQQQLSRTHPQAQPRSQSQSSPGQHQSQQLQAQLQQQQQQQAQQLKSQQPSSAPQVKGSLVAFGHKADWDFSTGNKKDEGQLDGHAKGKPLRLNGQTLALLASTDWGHLRTEVPINRHVTLGHACKPAHCGTVRVPLGNTAERQSTPAKGRPDSAPLVPSTLLTSPPKTPNIAAVKAGQQVPKRISPQLPKTLSFKDQPSMGSATSSPRSLSPDSYRAISGKAQTLANAAAALGSPKLANPRASSPLSRSGPTHIQASPSSGRHRSPSPLSRPTTAGHFPAHSAVQWVTPGRAAAKSGKPEPLPNLAAATGRSGLTARSRGRSWKAAQEEVRRLDQAKPSFMQSLRTRSLSPQSRAANSVTRPMWQQYERHVTPDRASARQGPIRRVFQGIARSASGQHDEQGRAFHHETPEAGPSGLEHEPNQAPTISAKLIKKRSAADRSLQAPTQSPAVKAWCPAGQAPFTARAAPSKPQSLGLQPCSSAASPSLASHSWLEGPSGARASPAQPQPIKAGQQALAALLSKQTAWESTRSNSLPPVLSQVTALLRCNSEPVFTVPDRTASELAMTADPQLGQSVQPAATAVGHDETQGQLVPSLEAAAVAAASAAGAAQELLDGSSQSVMASAVTEAAVAAQSAAPALKPALSSRGLRSELRVSFAKQLQTDIQAEVQQAQHGAACTSSNYFLEEGYFKEAGNVRGNGVGSDSQKGREAASGLEQEGGEREAADRGSIAPVAARLFDAG